MDELDRLLLEDSKLADKLYEIGSKSIRILVTGKTGTGKSALINGIIGVNVSKEGGLLNPTTFEVEKYNRTARGVRMLVYDSPGLQDGTENEKAYLLDMEKQCKKVDLVLYTVRMSDQRVNVGDVEAMKKLTIAFGKEFWGRAMFVMTFANEVRDPNNPDDDTSNQVFFEQRLRTWKEKLPKVMKELNVTKKIAEGIPVVPAGYYKNKHLPGRRYWFSQFWRAMFDRMKEYTEDGYTFLLQFNKDRFKRVYEATEEDFQKDIHEQPILERRSSTCTSAADELFSGYLVIVSFTLVSLSCL